MADLTDEQIAVIVDTDIMFGSQRRDLLAELQRRRAEERGEIARVPPFFAEMTAARKRVVELEAIIQRVRTLMSTGCFLSFAQLQAVLDGKESAGG